MATSVKSGNTVQITVPALQYVIVRPLPGTYTLKLVSGDASAPVALATAATAQALYGGYAAQTIMQLSVASGECAYEKGTTPIGGATTSLVSASRSISNIDSGLTLECTADAVTLTIPSGLAAGFTCTVIPSGTTSIASAGGTLLNGATTTVTRADSANFMFRVQSRASAADSYVVTGS
jgi:hypothetical protein